MGQNSLGMDVHPRIGIHGPSPKKSSLNLYQLRSHFGPVIQSLVPIIILYPIISHSIPLYIYILLYPNIPLYIPCILYIPSWYLHENPPRTICLHHTPLVHSPARAGTAPAPRERSWPWPPGAWRWYIDETLYICPYKWMYGYVWVCMIMYGYVWICVDMCGYAGVCMGMQGHAGVCINMYGYVWICVCGHVWICILRDCMGMDGTW